MSKVRITIAASIEFDPMELPASHYGDDSDTREKRLEEEIAAARRDPVGYFADVCGPATVTGEIVE